MKQVLYFFTSWCGVCRTTTPIINKLTEISVTKIDVDQNEFFADEWDIENLPTTIILEDGNEKCRHEGELTLNKLYNLING